MRVVISAMRRSLTSPASAGASANVGARRIRRPVSRIGVLVARIVSATGSSRVIARAPQERRRGAGNPVSPSMEPVWGPPVRLDAGGRLCLRRLFGRSLRHRLYRYENAAFVFGTELDATGGQCEQ